MAISDKTTLSIDNVIMLTLAEHFCSSDTSSGRSHIYASSSPFVQHDTPISIEQLN